jgi:hypothetical protein
MTGRAVFHQRVFRWLDDVLARAGRATTPA